MFKKFFVIGVLMLLIALARISEARPDTAVEFLTFGAGARATAMGEAFVAVVDDPTAVYWNPAGLSYQSQKGVTLMHNNLYQNLFNDMYYGGMVYACPLNSNTVIGGGVTYLYSGKHIITSFDPHTQRTVETGSFQTSDMSTVLSYAKAIGREKQSSLGMNLKYISSKFSYVHAKAYAVDFGIIYRPVPSLKVGATLKDWGTKLQYIDDYQADGLPTTLKVGASYQIGEDILVACDVVKPIYDDFTGVNFGIEGLLTEHFIGRVGYVNKEQGWKGLTYGGGIKFNRWQIDLANFPTGNLDRTSRVSITAGF